jgi:hypothetical protein
MHNPTYTPDVVLVDRLIHSRTAPQDVKALLLPLKGEFYAMLDTCPRVGSRSCSVSYADLVHFTRANPALMRVCLEVVLLASPASQLGQVCIEPDRSAPARAGSIRMQ